MESKVYIGNKDFFGIFGETRFNGPECGGTHVQLFPVKSNLHVGRPDGFESSGTRFDIF
jgi:hypothetical protein